MLIPDYQECSKSVSFLLQQIQEIILTSYHILAAADTLEGTLV